MQVNIIEAVKYAVDMKSLQEETLQFLMQCFGCARKVYNLYVDFLYQKLEKEGYINGDELPALKLPEVSSFKKIYPYLKKADSLALSNAKIDFEDAVKRYNKKSDHMTYTKRAKRRAESGTEPLTFRGLVGMPKFHARANPCRKKVCFPEKEKIYCLKHSNIFEINETVNHHPDWNTGGSPYRHLIRLLV